MAVPFIVRILPAGEPIATLAEGPTAGRALVEIYGGNFRLPPDPLLSGPQAPPSNGLVVAPVPQTVSVTFGGREAKLVEVIRSNLLHVTTPISPLPADAPDYGAGAVDVVITNLDDNGDPIPGESVTVVDGYTFRRVKLDATNPSDFQRLVRAMIREWKRQVLANVSFTTHVDYDGDTSTAFVEVAEMPAIVLQLTGTPENRFYSVNDGEDIHVGSEVVEVRRKPRTVDLEFDVLGISESTAELLNLMAVANDFMDRNPFISMDRDPSDPAKGSVEYELDFQDAGGFTLGTRPNNSSVRFFSGSILVRGFDFEALAGMPADRLAALTTRLQVDVELDAESFSG